MRRIRSVLMISLSLLSAGCSQQIGCIRGLNPSDTVCPANDAEVAIGDGFVENLCGCLSPGENGTQQVAPNPITCHIAAGGFVFFQFINTKQIHQIIPAPGSIFFPAGTVSDPSKTPLVETAPIPFPAGTYQFQAAYSALTGTIVAQ